MAKSNARLDAARKAYREALDVARQSPTSEAWTRLLAAGKELSAAEDPPRSRRGRRAQRPGEPAAGEPAAGEPAERPEHGGDTIEGLD